MTRKRRNKTPEASGSETIRWMHEKIRSIKSNEEVGIKFMNAWEEKILDRQEAQKEEREQGDRTLSEISPAARGRS